MKKNIILTLLLLCSISAVSAQSTLKTAYFMDRMTTRHEFNPALMNEYGYFSIPMLGDINFGLNSNLSVDKFIFPLDNGNLGLFAHPEVSSSEFLKGLNNNNVISQDLSLSILGFGFHAFGGYNTFDFSVRESFNVNLKKSLFEFMVGNNSGTYNMGGSSIDATAWAEIALGHSRRINDNLTVGAKVKYLIGAANADLEIETLDFITNDQEVALRANIVGNVAVVGMDLQGPLSELEFDNFNLGNGMNGGFGIDLGATYEMDDFTFSLAMTDIGFIRWSTASTVAANLDYSFTGFEDLDINDFDSAIESESDRLSEAFESLEDMEFTPATNYTTWLNANLNIGAEYQIFEDLLSAGALWTTTFGPATTTEFMLAATVSPSTWFDFALSGTVSSYGAYWGWALNFCPRWINFYIGMDSMIQGVTPQLIPYNSSNLNFKFGLSIPIGKVYAAN